MPRTHANEEVRILRFFEDAPLQKAELLFNIVKEKMRTRGGLNPSAEGRQTRKKEKHSTTSETDVQPQQRFESS